MRAWVAIVGGLALALAGCIPGELTVMAGDGGAGVNDATTGDAPSSGDGTTAGDRSASGPEGGGADGGLSDAGCVGLQCGQHSCDAGSTTLSGTVYDPAGINPVYEVAVYVPNAPVPPIVPGVTGYSCANLYGGKPIASTLTDAAGVFHLARVPDGANIPLVIQIGKWRKQITVPSVLRCQNNPLGKITLPKNHTADGDLPNIAVSTGGADSLECLLLRVGLDPAEFVGGATSTGRVHVFQGGTGQVASPNTQPPGPASPAALWDTQADLAQFDAVMLSCEGQETTGMNQAVMFAYTAAGGRMLASHFHYAWFNTGPFAAGNLATWSAGSDQLGNINALTITSFPKGVELATWLSNVGALTAGELPIQQARHNADLTAANMASQAWLAADMAAIAPNATQAFTFNTPLGMPPASQVGRVVYTDLHVGAVSGDYAGSSVTPTGCAHNPMSPQEKALEFLLFDLMACVTPDSQPPVPPPVQ